MAGVTIASIEGDALCMVLPAVITVAGATERTASDVTVVSGVVTVPDGYYGTAVTKTVPYASQNASTGSVRIV